MAKLLLVLGLSVGLFAAMPTASAHADIGALPQLSLDVSLDTTGSFVGWGDFWSWLRDEIESIKTELFGGSSSGTTPAGSSGASVPELDMTVAGSAVVLLLGGVAYLASRRREQE
jgi:hypothetical protein